MGNLWAFLFRYSKRPLPMAFLGLASVFVIWIIPALVFNWDEWSSFAFKYGDFYVLPFFCMIASWLISKRQGTIPKWSIIAVLAGGLLIGVFEPDATQMRKTGSILSWLRLYHLVFIVFLFSFILFMCAVYPFLREKGQSILPDRVSELRIGGSIVTVAWWIPLTALCLLMLTFLGFVFVADDWIHNFPLWNKGTTVGLLVAIYVFLVIDRTFHVVEWIGGMAARIKKQSMGGKRQQPSQ